MLSLDQNYDFHGDQVAWGWLDGPDDAAPLVLIHGFPWSAQAWRRIAPWLARHRRVYFFDLLGCGQSAKAERQDVRPSVQNQLLAELIDHWGLHKPAVVGHDFGGLAALRGHYISGVDYGELTLIDAVSLLPSGSPFFAHAKQHFDAFANTPGFTHDALFEAFVNFGSLHGLSREVVEMYAKPWRGAVGQPAFYRQIEQSGPEFIQEVQDRYGPLPFPTHLIWGRHDDNIPVAQGLELADALQADSFTVVPEAAHIVMEDAPEAVVAGLLGARDARR
jgi:pimeloyl-ACP methyl ester carboxylesterase